MRFLHLVTLPLALAVAGCAGKRGGSPPAPTSFSPYSPAGNPRIIVTPDDVPAGRVTRVNAASGFVVLNYPTGRVPEKERRLNLYRHGLKVAEIKVTGPQNEDNTIADVLAGEAQVGDEARDR